MRLYAALFAIGLVVYGALAWDRIGRQSAAPHFVLQADAWLHGNASVEATPSDDWAKVETVALDDGSEVRGRRMVTQRVFLTLGGDKIDIARVRESRGAATYVSFPPLPSVLMIPSALIAGRAGNDVIPTLLVAAAILPLALLVLRRLAAASQSRRSLGDDLWLVAALAFGSVLFYSAVQGSVWYAAQIVGVALALVYVWASIEAKHPIAAGLALGAAALTRTSMAFMVPLFLFEAWRMQKFDRRTLLQFAAPIVAFAILGMIYNYIRFASPTEFGHTYLDVRQQLQIERWGLASFHYLERNLAAAFVLLPEWLGQAPWIRISGHGLAIWVTTPLLLYVVWPREKPALHRPLWICTLLVALPSLLYMNTGWLQFGYRFSLDYIVFLIALVAIGGRPLGRIAKVLIIVGIAINLFGAVTFYRSWQYYGNNYDAVVRN